MFSQVVSQTIGPLLQLPEGHPTGAADHGDALGNEVDGMFDEIRDIDGHASKVERVIVAEQ
ncbi:hypothetical protein JOF53_001930 [Crossiella equi]|uniref:Uncharacterized protein n=1 Tax=Crossiella equi TaxID=130796 RepID=A0ABS5A902_9PSEU|nr:hypothetical protein [Crossiella equi]